MTERLTPREPVSLTADELASSAHDKLDALLLDMRRLSSRVDTVSNQVAAVEKSARDRGHRLADALTAISANQERTEAALLELTAIASDLRAEVRAVSRVVGGDVDTRASIHDMTAEELARLESNGLRAQMRAVMATLATTKRTGLAAAGLGGVLSIEMLVRIALEILR